MNCSVIQRMFKLLNILRVFKVGEMLCIDFLSRGIVTVLPLHRISLRGTVGSHPLNRMDFSFAPQLSEAS